MAQASAEIEHTGPAEKERVASVPQREHLASTPEPHLPKRKGTEYQIMRKERVKEGKSRTLAREWGNQSGSMERKGWTPRGTKADSREASKKSLPRRGRRKHERVSRRKSSSGRSAESWFHSKSGQT